MAKPFNKKTAPPAPRMITVLKNQLTKVEMDQISEQFINDPGPFLTIAEVLAIEQAKQRPESPQSQPDDH